MTEEGEGDLWFICVTCGEKSRTGHFKMKLCHRCYLDKMRKASQ